MKHTIKISLLSLAILCINVQAKPIDNCNTMHEDLQTINYYEALLNGHMLNKEDKKDIKIKLNKLLHKFNSCDKD